MENNINNLPKLESKVPIAGTGSLSGLQIPGGYAPKPIQNDLLKMDCGKNSINMGTLGTTDTTSTPATTDLNSVDVISAEKLELERKRKLNREAQRAYRERKNNRLGNLEDSLKLLHRQINTWEKKFKKSQKELKEVKKQNTMIKKENENLKLQIKTQGHDLLSETASSEIPAVSTYGPSLQELIENFKPMKAISLNKQKNKIYKNNSKIKLQSKVKKPIFHTLSSVPKCGLCTEDDICVCKQMEVPPVGETNFSYTQPIYKSSTKLTCHSNPKNCTECADIEKSCLGKNLESTNENEDITLKNCHDGKYDSSEWMKTISELDYMDVGLQLSPKKHQKDFKS